MEQFSDTITQIQQFLAHHLPETALNRIGLGSVATVLAGIFLCVAGAKLARFAIAGGWAVAGGFLGAAVAQAAGVSPWPVILLFAAGTGVIGHMTYRIWVGAVTGIVITAVVLGAFGFQRFTPQLAEFNIQHGSAEPQLVAHEGGVADLGGEFVVPTPAEQASNRDQVFRAKVQELWDFATANDPNLGRHGMALGTTALIFGLLIGLMSVRWTMILSTATLGALLFSVGAVAGLGTLMPSISDAALSRPIMDVIIFGVAFLVSVFLQARLTRPARAEAAPEDALIA